MKAVKRKNGMMMADLNIKFTVAAGHLVKAVQQDLAVSGSHGKPVDCSGYSRTTVEKLLRACLKDEGDSMLRLENDNEFEDEAWAIVRQLFPEMCAPS